MSPQNTAEAHLGSMDPSRAMFSCDYCRRRKQKCTRELPSCSNCIRYSKQCVYTTRQGRVPITKSQMKSLKDQIMMLRRALDLSTGNNSADTQRYIYMATKLQEVQNKQVEEPSFSMNRDQAGETDYDEAGIISGKFLDIDQLNWHEKSHELDDFFDQNDPSRSKTVDHSMDGLVDGMGALPLNSGANSEGLNFGQVFYGISSSNGLLRYLKKSDSTGSRRQQLLRPLVNLSHLNQKDNVEFIKSGLYETLLEQDEFKNEIIASYFKNYHPCYPFVNKKVFLKNKSLQNINANSTKSISFQILYYTILCIGAYCKYGEKAVIDLLYYKRVKSSLSRINILECGNYELLVALTLLGNYLQRRNKPNTCWNYQGLALRMAIGFGLHKEIQIGNDASYPNPSNIKAVQIVETRRRLWWGLFFFDVGLSITFGRPLHLPKLQSIDIKYPLNLDENDEELSLLTQNLLKTYPTVYSGLISEAKLSKISCEIQDFITSTPLLNAKNHTAISNYLSLLNLITLNSKLLVDGFVSKLPRYFNLDSSIANSTLHEICPNDWFNIGLDGSKNIPGWFQLTRRRINWRYKNLQIVMFRSCILNSQFKKDEKEDSASESYIELLKEGREICANAAKDTINSVMEFVETCEINTLSSWYSCYFLFQASLIPVLFLFKEDQKDTQIMWLELIDTSKKALLKLESHLAIVPNLIQTLDIMTSPIKERIVIGSDFGVDNEFLEQDTNDLINNLFDQPQFMNNIQSTTIGLFSNQNEELSSGLPVSDFWKDFSLTSSHDETESIHTANSLESELPKNDVISELMKELFPDDPQLF